MTITTGKRAECLAKVRAAITQFVLERNGVSTADICAKLHMSDSGVKRYAQILTKEGQIVRYDPPNIGRGVGLTLWFAPGAELPVFVPPPPKTQGNIGSIKGKRQHNDYPKAVKVKAAQTGMVRSDPLMVGLFGPAGS